MPGEKEINITLFDQLTLLERIERELERGGVETAKKEIEIPDHATGCNILKRHLPISIFEICQYISRHIFVFVFLYHHPLMDVMTIISAAAYPYTYPISSRWVYALTFLHSALWIKARDRLVLNCCLFGLMEVSSLSPRHYRLPLFSGGSFQLLSADIPKYFVRIILLFLLCQRMDQRQYLLADNDKRLHLPQRGFLPRFQVMV